MRDFNLISAGFCFAGAFVHFLTSDYPMLVTLILLGAVNYVMAVTNE